MKNPLRQIVLGSTGCKTRVIHLVIHFFQFLPLYASFSFVLQILVLRFNSTRSRGPRTAAASVMQLEELGADSPLCDYQ